MKTKIKRCFGNVLLCVFVLAIAVFIMAGFVNVRTLSQVKSSMSTPLRAEEDSEAEDKWTVFKTVEEPEPLESRLRSADSRLVRDGYFYIGHEDVVNISSLFCCQYGVTIPGREDLKVSFGYGEPREETDSGEIIRFLRPDMDLFSQTAFKESHSEEYTEENDELKKEGNSEEYIDENGEIRKEGQDEEYIDENGEFKKEGNSEDGVISTKNYPGNVWTDWHEGQGDVPTLFPNVHIIGVGYYKLENMIVRDANPAEAWILNEYANNIEPDPSYVFDNGEGASLDGWEIPASEADKLTEVHSHGFIVYSYNGSEYRKYDGSYYRIKWTDKDDENALHDESSYVQYAWWTTKTGEGENLEGYDLKETDLALEAHDFQTYVETVAERTYERDEDGKISPDPYDENGAVDGLFKIDYLKRVEMTPEKVADADVLWDPYLNKYIIGPLKVKYDRFVTKRGDREKVSFCGISDVKVTAETGDGGTIELVRGQDFEITYNDDQAHDEARNPLDTEEEYPYPAPEEEFYVTVNYSVNDDEDPRIIGIVEIEFSFDYLTAGGSYEFYKGNYLVTDWGQEVDWENQKSRTRTIKVLTGWKDKEEASLQNKDYHVADSDEDYVGNDSYKDGVLAGLFDKIVSSRFDPPPDVSAPKPPAPSSSESSSSSDSGSPNRKPRW